MFLLILSTFQKKKQKKTRDSKKFISTHSGSEGDDLLGGDAVPSVVPRKVRGIPVVRFAFGTSNLLS